MSEAITQGEQARYNALAIETAQQLHEARVKSHKQSDTRERNIHEIFYDFNRTGVGVALEYEAMGNRPVSEPLEARAAEFGARFEHLGTTLGTVVHDVDLKHEQSAEFIDFVRACLLERKVIFFRDQNLTQNEQVAFGERFGGLDAFPFGKPGKNPYILEIIHGKDFPGTENSWHTDVTWMERPSLGSIAQCIDVPPYGGDTLFSDSAAAYLGLPAALQTRLQNIEGVNDYRMFISAGTSEELIAQIKQRIPFGVSHPLLRTHPETGKTSLYLHGGFLRHNSLHDVSNGKTLEEKESSAIVRVLLQQHPRPEYTCRFKWAPGSIAFWDNRAVQHYAASDYYPHRRLLRRVTICGDKPYYNPQPGEQE